jgi:hypothetical protein
MTATPAGRCWIVGIPVHGVKVAIRICGGAL